MNDVSGAVTIMLFASLWVLAIVLLVAPSIIAFRRGHPNRWLILLVNIVLAGTVIGWLAALIWALRIVEVPGEERGRARDEAVSSIPLNDSPRLRLEPNLANPTELDRTATATDEILEKIERLQRLYAEGHISTEEFKRLKAAMLGKV